MVNNIICILHIKNNMNACQWLFLYNNIIALTLTTNLLYHKSAMPFLSRSSAGALIHSVKKLVLGTKLQR